MFSYIFKKKMEIIVWKSLFLKKCPLIIGRYKNLLQICQVYHELDALAKMKNLIVTNFPAIFLINWEKIFKMLILSKDFSFPISIHEVSNLISDELNWTKKCTR